MTAHGARSLAAFAAAARVYWLSVYPRAARELRHWRRRALAIEDDTLRGLALVGLAKRGNMEGAAAFALLAPPARRAQVVRAAIAFQTLYNHLDVLSEQGHNRSFERAAQMHRALVTALSPATAPAAAHDADGGPDLDYRAELMRACQSACADLPSAAVALPLARQGAEMVVAFQAHQAEGTEAPPSRTLAAPGSHLPEERGFDDAHDTEQWGHHLAGPRSQLRWWEAAAAAGSSLAVHAAIALAAETSLCAERAQRVYDAYFPWIAALHSLLDHLVDAREDTDCGQRNLIACYGSDLEVARRLGWLAGRARTAAVALDAAEGRVPAHELLLAAMAGLYLSDPGAAEPHAQSAAAAVRERIGTPARAAIAVFAVRRAATRLRRDPRPRAGNWRPVRPRVTSVARFTSLFPVDD